MPTAFEFCLPTAAKAAPAGPNWFHEIKYDGYRLCVQRRGDDVRLITRNGHDWTSRYPWIVESARKNRETHFILDGEAVVLGVDGVADFNALHSRKHDHEVQLYAFDVLALPAARPNEAEPADAERVGAGAAEIDAAAGDERAEIGRQRLDRGAVAQVRDAEAAAEIGDATAARWCRDRAPRYRSAAARRAAALVAVADAVLRGDADLDAEPQRAGEAGDDGGQDDLGGQRLRALDALAPFAQVHEVGAQLETVILLDSRTTSGWWQPP
jgi:hypothetical protein